MDPSWLLQRLPLVPPIFSDESLDKYGYKVQLPTAGFPVPSFASKRPHSSSSTRPQVIAHRGYTARAPENTLLGFADALAAGAHAIETDLHLTRDGVVVLSHDPDLKRCFGLDRRLADCDWDYVKTLQTLRSPVQFPTRLRDLLYLLQKPAWHHVWLLLDIKADDDPGRLMRCIREDFDAIEMEPLSKPWKERVVLGYWTGQFIPLCHQELPGFPITNVGFSPKYSAQFMPAANTSFTILQATLISSSGRNFIDMARSEGRVIYSWTVNDDKNMDWCICQGLDGVVTDKVPELLEMCKTFQEEQRHVMSWKLWLGYTYFNFWVQVFEYVFRVRYGSSVKTP